MKRVLKYVGLGFVALVVLGGVGITYLAMKKPAQRPPPEVKIQANAAMVERGKYLAESVADCVECHSDHEMDKFALPIPPGKAFIGGTCVEGDDIPARICPPNLTPSKAGLAAWSDGELLRAIREGVAKDGHALFPIMPYREYRAMSDEDAQAIIAYLRSLPANDNLVPPTKYNFIVDIMIKGRPQPLEGAVKGPDKSDKIAYGKYLATIATCVGCHTPADDAGNPLPGMEFAGGMDFAEKTLHAVSANITPDPETGIGNMTEEQFVGMFKAYATLPSDTPAPPGRNTIMPWRSYSRMSDDDLKAIYAYLRTVKPIVHKVNHFPDAKI